jgi:hypothetical protein
VTEKLTKEQVVKSWELMVARARDERDQTADPHLRAVRDAEVEALERRLAEIRESP